MREQQIGHVGFNSTVHQPWSHYFCCMLAGNREFVRKYPVVTKRALRAILKAADFCRPHARNARSLEAASGQSSCPLTAQRSLQFLCRKGVSL